MFQRKKPFSLLTASLLVLASVLGSLLLPQDAHAAYIASDLIDNIIFTNAGSMDQGQIQTFLSGKGGYIAGYSTFSGRDGGNVPASRIIAEAASDYGINPQAIMATLQKEQSLVTDPSPSQSQLNCAMGYLSCDGSHNSFYSQVDAGTWQLRYSYEASSGRAWGGHSVSEYPCKNATNLYSAGLYPGNTVTFYNSPGGSARTITLANAATASLYCYTPYVGPYSQTGYSGSYNFVINFEAWFGSTLASPLVKSSSSPSIYLLDSDGQTLHPIPSYDIMSAFGLSSTPVTVVNSLSDFTVGSTLHTLIQRSDGGIYLVDHGVKYAINSGATCTNWGLGCFDTNQVTTGMGDRTVDAVPVAGTLPALQNNNGAVYLMKNGNKEPVISPSALFELGYGWGDVAPISNYNSTQPLGPLHIPNGMAVKYKSGDGIYLYDNGAYNAIQDINLVSAWNLNVIANPPASSYDTTPPPVSSDVLSNFATDGRDTYLIDQGMRKYITSGLSAWTTGSTHITSFAHAALAKLPSSSATTIIRAASGGIYALQNGAKRPIPSFNDFYGLGLSPSQLTNVSDYTASTLATGNVDLPDSALFQVSGNPGIYLVNNQGATWLSTPNDFSYFGFNSRAVEQFPSSVLTAYPASSDGLLVLVRNDSGQVYTASNGTLYVLSSKIVNDWGLGSASPTLLSNKNLSSLGKSNMTNFARTPSGSIYYGQGGSAHPISSYNEFLSLGGSSSNTINVAPEFIALCPVGSTL